MNKLEFEQFVLQDGKDILRFCTITAGSEDAGSDLYQDTMLRLLEKRSKLDSSNNVKSYALSVAVLLWKNRKKKYAARLRLAPEIPIENEDGEPAADIPAEENTFSSEAAVLKQEQKEEIRRLTAQLSEDLRIPVYLFYTADQSIAEISKVLEIPEGTVKTRLRRAKRILKSRLEELGYD